MPELPEVEVVRRGLAAHVTGRTISAVRVHHPRAVRRHEAGPADLTARLLDARITGTGRRGKYLWLTLDDGDEPLGRRAEGSVALVVHLGMSGQMLLGEVPNANHVRIATLLDDGTALSFVDQRTFGGWMLADLVTVDGTADVMSDALGQGGTSFDSLYVNVNGESGYFDRSLDAYGREGEPCRRCGAVMRREKFMNRSSFYCPKCQPRPRVPRS